MKRTIFILSFLIAFSILFSAYAESTIMIVSDPHYCSPRLYQNSGLFIRSISQGDGKLVHHSDLLLRAIIAQAEAIHPDVLLITGDLTFNGEKESHQELASALETLVSHGIAVYVIPGNHDINCKSALKFVGDSYTTTESVTADEFKEIYSHFLGDISQENIGISYTVSPAQDLTLCMLDCSFYEPVAYTFGLLDDNRYSWFEEKLIDSEINHRLFISATHHSVIPHSSLWKESFVILNAERLSSTLVRHGARIHLSGHLHIQHISEQDGLYDIASGAFSVYPHRYGLLTVDDHHHITYHALPLDEALLPEGFMKESEQWFRTTTQTKTQSSLMDANIPDPEKTIMLEYAEDLNLAYFSGALMLHDPVWTERDGYHLWMQYSDRLSFGQYLNQILSEASINALSLSVP